jgi:hypothetical protein
VDLLEPTDAFNIPVSGYAGTEGGRKNGYSDSDKLPFG